jgi:hypothetical protein
MKSRIKRNLESHQMDPIVASSYFLFSEMPFLGLGKSLHS